MFIPKANLPLEAADWRKWVEKRETDQETLNAEVRAFMERAGRGASTGARQTANINLNMLNLDAEMGDMRALPDGDATPLILRTTDTAEPYWSGETIDQVVTYFVTLGTGVSSVEVYAGNSNAAMLLPTADIIGPDELTMFQPQNATLDQRPINLELSVSPASDLEEFEVWLPAYENDFGNTAPFWSLHLVNLSSSNRARLNIIGQGLIYAGTNVPVLGDTDTWDLDADFDGAWVVQQAHRALGVNAATPLSAPGNIFSGVADPIPMDKFYSESVRGRSHMLSFTEAGGLSTGVLSQTYYNDSASKQFITFARATVGTAPTGASLLVDVRVDGVTEFTATVAASATTGTATPAAQPWPVQTGIDFFTVDWPVGSYVTVDVTQVGSTIPGSDLTVQVWAG